MYFNNSPFVSWVLRASPSALDSCDSESDKVSDTSTSDTLLVSLSDSEPEPPFVYLVIVTDPNLRDNCNWVPKTSDILVRVERVGKELFLNKISRHRNTCRVVCFSEMTSASGAPVFVDLDF